MPAFFTTTLTSIRDLVSGIVSHVGVSTDTTEFAAGQTRLDPTEAGQNIIKEATITPVDATTFDATITLDGSTDTPVDIDIATIAAQEGVAATDALTRTVRARTIGFEATDVFVIGPRVTVADTTP